jgi:hypothetical protein
MLVPTNVLGSLAALVSAEAAHGCFGRLEARSREPIIAELLRGYAALHFTFALLPNEQFDIVRAFTNGEDLACSASLLHERHLTA